MTRFLTSAVSAAQWPESEKEYLLVGRSNVGKSTFINCLFGQKVAYVGKTPGKTRMLNFYQAEGFTLVDAPGYGYAKRTQKEQLQYRRMMNEYFERRKALKEVLLLLDVRRIPSEDDRIMLDYVRQTGTPYRIVITKMDKQSRNQNIQAVNKIAAELEEDRADFILTDIRRKDVYQELLKQLSGTGEDL
ncbi:MAG: ribosome biogenesis GTP-binding protein YsxC [Erysipelotrichaceae bacterium]|nr:ribosome biogenesis GTP-binding protein YsxC [Erysipelotrichaceae bacterium]MBQ1809816.1 ribosome biogenesis GTP-binding protein YsxC [Erysipelotrichaceae bacterium]